MTRRSLEGARAILTGASSGIGREMACELARKGASLLLTARREDRLTELVSQLAEISAGRKRGAEARHAYVAGDLVESEVRRHLVEEAERRWGAVDLLINNAGIGAIGPFAAAGPERMRRIFEVNFFAPAELVRSAFPLLRLGNRPLIANVSSVLGHRAVPNKSEYSASKFALHGWSDSLRAELRRKGIDVLLISPSTTASEFFDNVIENKGRLPWRRLGAASPAWVARKGVRAIERGSHEVILTLGGKMLVWLDRFWPWAADHLVARFQ